ncbi:MAG: hypothetical protein H0W77_13300 [Acidobacteria bacterium]|nr:hypothetical protein [Acidobacteriota bacterium]
MKKILMQICLAVGLVTGLIISAQAQMRTQYRAHVPFDFKVGGQSFQAGDYVLGLTNPSTDNRALTIRDINSGKAKIILIMPRENNERLNVSKLVFNRYDDRYYLSEMITPTLGAEFRKTKNEVLIAEKQKSKSETMAIKLNK